MYAIANVIIIVVAGSFTQSLKMAKLCKHISLKIDIISFKVFKFVLFIDFLWLHAVFFVDLFNFEKLTKIASHRRLQKYTRNEIDR